MVANQAECKQVWTEVCHQTLAAEKMKPCEIYRKFCVVYKWAKHGFATTSLSRKDIESPVKKKVSNAAISKERYADSLVGYEVAYHY